MRFFKFILILETLFVIQFLSQYSKWAKYTRGSELSWGEIYEANFIPPGSGTSLGRYLETNTKITDFVAK